MVVDGEFAVRCGLKFIEWIAERASWVGQSKYCQEAYTGANGLPGLCITNNRYPVWTSLLGPRKYC